MGIFATIFGAKAQKKAAKNSLKETRGARDTARSYYAPYIAQAPKTFKAYNDAVGLGDSAAAIDAFHNSPEYLLNLQRAIDEGTAGVQRVGQSTGTYNSGRTLKALQDRAQQTSDGFYQNYLARLSGANTEGYNANVNGANLETGQAQEVSNGLQKVADAKTAPWEGIDNLISGGLKLYGGLGGKLPQVFGSNPNPTNYSLY